MDATVLLALLVWLALALTPIVVFVLVFHGGRVGRGLGRLLGRLLGRPVARLLAPWRRRRPPVTTVAPLEQVAADLRRLYPGVHTPVPGTRMAKQRGVVLAYDEHLVTASTALDVTTCLLQLAPGGVDRELERLRVEHALTDAGLVLRP